MLGLIVWFFLFAALSCGIFALNYWVHLFRFKDTYTKSELLDFMDILKSRYRLITDGDVPGNLLLVIGIAFGWLCILFGGLLSPDRLMAPDFTEDFATNYFFQSVLFPLLLHILWPSFETLTEGGPLSIFAKRRYPFLIGLCLSLAPAGVAFWGSYYQLTFLWVFLNLLLLSGYAFLLMELQERGEQDGERGFQTQFSGDDAPADLDSDNDLEI